jgi:cyanate permease
MQFEYEISSDDYVRGLILYRRLTRRIGDAGWFLSGTLLTVIGLIERERGWSPILLAAIGVWCMYAGIGRLFPASLRRNFQRSYQRLALMGKKYQANVTEVGFDVVGENTSWQVPWAEVSAKGEDEALFMFHWRGILFVFAKRFLEDEQQRELRTRALLPG